MMDDPTDAPRSYEAGIFARLEGVKAAYDPNNLFRDLNYVHPNLPAPVGDSYKGKVDAPPPMAAEAMAITPNNAVSGTQAPQPMQG